MAACDKSLDHVRAFSIVIPVERSGLCPDRESRNPVNTGLACRVGCARPLANAAAVITGSRLARARRSRARLAGMTAHMRLPWVKPGGDGSELRSLLLRLDEIAVEQA